MTPASTILQLGDLHGFIEPHAELVRAGLGDRYRQTVACGASMPCATMWLGPATGTQRQPRANGLGRGN